MLGLGALPSWSEVPDNGPTRRNAQVSYILNALTPDSWKLGVSFVHKVNRPPLEENRSIVSASPQRDGCLSGKLTNGQVGEARPRSFSRQQERNLQVTPWRGRQTGAWDKANAYSKLQLLKIWPAECCSLWRFILFLWH
jgi:hypothetical protein